MKVIKGIVIAILLSVVFVGCAKPGHSVIPNDNKADFKIEYLFECDGVKMYRFCDNGRYRYFTTGNGRMTSSIAVHGKTIVDDTVIQ
jgi:hypothetical protein